MTQFEQILELWTQAEKTSESAVLATVVKTQGSSYRLPGARLLVTRDGRRAGSISGGCLEDDLVKKAWWLTEEGPAIRRYDTTPEGEIGPSFGLGCNGIIHVLLERIHPGASFVLDLLREVRSSRRPAAIAHFLQPREQVGQRLVIDVQGVVQSPSFDRRVQGWWEQQLRSALRDKECRTVMGTEEQEAFLEVLTPPVHLLVFGAGDDAVPVVNLAKYLGWRVSVLDGRAHYARRERFPQADEVLTRPAGESGMRSAVDPWTAMVVMTHSYAQDLKIIGEVSGESFPYLGILGPRKRSEQLWTEAGLDTSRIGLILHSPMGLDIGADGPEQVALAIIAEVQARFNGRRGGFLRERAGSIHSEEEEIGAGSATPMSSIACV